MQLPKIRRTTANYVCKTSVVSVVFKTLFVMLGIIAVQKLNLVRQLLTLNSKELFGTLPLFSVAVYKSFAVRKTKDSLTRVFVFLYLVS